MCIRDSTSPAPTRDPSRVSTNRPDADRNPDSNQPDTSTITSVSTNDDTHTSPDASTGTTTAFGSIAPAAPTAVTFNATPTTSVPAPSVVGELRVGWCDRAECGGGAGGCVG